MNLSEHNLPITVDVQSELESIIADDKDIIL